MAIWDQVLLVDRFCLSGSELTGGELLGGEAGLHFALRFFTGLNVKCQLIW